MPASVEREGRRCRSLNADFHHGLLTIRAGPRTRCSSSRQRARSGGSRRYPPMTEKNLNESCWGSDGRVSSPARWADISGIGLFPGRAPRPRVQPRPGSYSRPEAADAGNKRDHGDIVVQRGALRQEQPQRGGCASRRGGHSVQGDDHPIARGGPLPFGPSVGGRAGLASRCAVIVEDPPPDRSQAWKCVGFTHWFIGWT